MGSADTSVGEWRKQIFFRLMYLEDVALADSEVELDFTVESLRAVEREVVDRFGAAGKTSRLPEWSFVESVATYLGETLMRLAGGVWDVDEEGRPVVKADTALGLGPLSPIQAVMDAAQAGDGERFAALYQGWERAVAGMMQERPGWQPTKERTMADPPPQDSDHLSAWLEQREAAFPAWVATYGPDVTWDFSPDSLPQLEQVLRQVVGSEEALYDTANREFRDGAAWYFGEVMRRGLGGHWAYDARFDKDRNFEYLDGVGPTKSMSRPVIFLEVALTESGELRRHYDDFST